MAESKIRRRKCRRPHCKNTASKAIAEYTEDWRLCARHRALNAQRRKADK